MTVQKTTIRGKTVSNSDVVVNFGGNTQDYDSSLSKSQKKTQQELAKMDKAVEEFGNKFKDTFSSTDAMFNQFGNSLMGKGGGVILGIGAIGAAAAMTGRQIIQMGMDAKKASDELVLGAQRANMSQEQFQKWGALAKMNGIEIEKFGDQMKDVQDKVSEYMVAGMGAFQDYFDTVGIELGQTIDDFKGLTGDQILEKVIKSLDEVGASAGDATFVLESLASDLSNLSPLVGKSEADITQMMLGYAVQRNILSDDTSRNLSRMTNNFDTMNQNLDNAFAETFSSLFDYLAETAVRVDGAVRGYTKNLMVDRIGGKIATGENVSDSDLRFMSDPENQKLVKEYLKNLNSDKKKGDTSLYNQMNRIGVTGNQGKDELEESRKGLDAAFAKIINSAADQKLAEEQKRASTSTGSEGVSTPKAYSNTEGASKEVQRLNQQRDALNKDLAELEGKMADATMRGQEKYQVVLKQDIEKKKKEIANNKEMAVNASNDLAKFREAETKKRQADQDKADREALQREQSYYDNRVKMAVTEADKITLQAEQEIYQVNQMRGEAGVTEQMIADKIVQINEDKIKRLDDLEQKRLQNEKNAANERLQAQIAVATTEEERNKLKYQVDENRYKEFRAKGLITQQEFDNKIAEMERVKQAEKDEREVSATLRKEERDVLLAEKEIEFLQKQYKDKEITKDEFDAQMLEKEKELAVKNRALFGARVGDYEKMMDGIASLAEEGSRQQKMLFLASKAATIANMTLNMWDSWGEITESGWAGALKKAEVIASYTAGIAQVGSVTLGQFHDGQSYVPSTGSYILEKGERVVSASQNKDLENFMGNGSGGAGGGITINSDLVIEGDTTMSDDQFISKLAAHRENLLNFTNLAKREQGF